MKKLGVVIFFVLIVSSRYQFVDMSQYETTKKTIEIKGEVHDPGVYEVDAHAKVDDIIRIAGGCTPDADMSGINLSLDIGNEGVIVIPEIKEETLISINSADASTLDELPGVGPSIAQRIIEYRSQTPFQSLEDIKNVKGIGDAMFEKIKDRICL